MIFMTKKRKPHELLDIAKFETNEEGKAKNRTSLSG